MKVIWEEEDIRPGRKFVKTGSRKDTKDIWMIGYLCKTTTGNSYVSISMTDGLCSELVEKKELAEILNKQQYTPLELL